MPPQWPGKARAAISLTLDNMGEACDLDRDLWPASEPIGSHYSVRHVLPEILALLHTHNISVTYFIESWNLAVYPDPIRVLEAAGHEVAWHAFRHENWGKLEAGEERANFERSFGEEGWGRGVVRERYRGFRPPGGKINGERTLGLCREFGLEYISPAAEEAAVLKGSEIVVLPFRWLGVDATYYMETFGKLRVLKGMKTDEVLSPADLVESYQRQIDQTIEKGGFLSLLFHPFLTNVPERMSAMETVVGYLAAKRDQGAIWLARCRDVADHVKQNPGLIGDDPVWDNSSWR